MTPELKKAFDHIREFHPNVCKVKFDNDLCWLYYDNEGNIPTFDKRINVSILENAADSITEYPSVFEL